MAGRANRMKAASCCDININTVQQLLVTVVSWTKHGRIMTLLPVQPRTELCGTFQNKTLRPRHHSDSEQASIKPDKKKKATNILWSVLRRFYFFDILKHFQVRQLVLTRLPVNVHEDKIR